MEEVLGGERCAEAARQDMGHDGLTPDKVGGPRAPNHELLAALLKVREFLNSPPISQLLDEVKVPVDGQRLLDESDAATLIGIPAKTLGNLRRRGELPASTYVQFGRRCRVRYVRDALLLYFKINHD